MYALSLYCYIGYDLERDRVLRLRPKDRDYVNVTGQEGIRVFMTVKDELTQTKEVGIYNIRQILYRRL